jgi:hypothetical protein
MSKRLSLLVFAAFVFALAGCQHLTSPVKVEEASIPDQTYDVTAYWSAPLYQAVLFDLPDDGEDVAMFYTYAVERVGMDTPQKYVDRFDASVRWYRTLQINDLEGNVRGYLMISNKLGYFFYQRPKGERIVVQIYDPHLGGDGSMRLP